MVTRPLPFCVCEDVAGYRTVHHRLFLDCHSTLAAWSFSLCRGLGRVPLAAAALSWTFVREMGASNSVLHAPPVSPCAG